MYSWKRRTMSKPIYTITTIRPFLGDSNRTVGFYYDFETADKLVRENAGDMNECNHYPFAVIEETLPGIYTYPRPEHWYEWNRQKEVYEPCEKPDRYKQVVGWGIG
jgi:hypothetical protein